MKKKTRFSRLVAGLTAFLLVLTPMPFGEIGISNGIGITASAEETTSDDSAETDPNEGENTADEEEISFNEDATSAEENIFDDVTKIEKVIFVDNSVALADSDELFCEYVNRVFYGNTNNIINSNPQYGYQSLSAGEKEIYDGLKPSIIEIANGKISKTVITVYSDLWEYTKESFRKIHIALLTDLPYELYWYDKTSGIHISYSISAGRYTFSFNVAEAYAGSEAYTTDIEKTGAASNAAANAQDIVDKYQKLSDYGKLVAYCDKLCEMVDYNHEAVDNDYPYGDPWQLIYAFDGDPATNIVCEGYSKAFQYLYDLSTFNNPSIKCAVVSGTMNGGGHMWNIVSIDGVSYLVDVTNCDASTPRNDYLFLKGMMSSSATGFTAKFFSKQIKYVYYSDTVNQYSSDFLTLSTKDYEPSEEDIAKLTVNLNNSALTLRVNGEDVDGNSAEVKFSDKVEVYAKIKDFLNKTIETDATADLDHGFVGCSLSKDNTYLISELIFEKNETEFEGESTLNVDLIDSPWTQEELSQYIRLDIDEGINVHPYSFETGETVGDKTLSNGDYYPNRMPVSITADSTIFSGRYIGVNGVEVLGEVDSNDLFRSSDHVYLVGKDGVVEISFISDGYSFSTGFNISAYVDGQSINTPCKLKDGTVVDLEIITANYIDHKLVINGEKVTPILDSKYHKKFTYRYTVDGEDVNASLEEEEWSEEERTKYVKLEIGQNISAFVTEEGTEHDAECVFESDSVLLDGEYYPKGCYVEIIISKEYGEGKKLTVNGEGVNLNTDKNGNYYLKYKVNTEENVLTIEFEAAVTLIADNLRFGFDDLADAIAYINKNGAFDATAIFNKDITLTSLAIPKNVSNFTLKNKDGVTVNFNMSTLTVSANTTLDIDTVSECLKPLTISIPAGKTLNIKNFVGKSAAIKGTNTSVLNVEGHASLSSISTLYLVNVEDKGSLFVSGNISGVSALNGSLCLPDPSSAAVIKTIEKASVEFFENGEKIAKLTVSDVNTSLEVSVSTDVYDKETNTGEIMPAVLANGTTLLWAGSTEDFTDKITITNKTASGQKLDAYLYGKEIKAEYGNAVTVNDGTKEKGYPNLDLALKSITDVDKSYTVTLNDYLTVKKLALPKTATKITFDGEGGLNLNMTTLSIPTNVTFLAAVYGTNAKPLALSVAAGKTLEIGGKAVNIGAVKGTKTSELDVNTSSTFSSVATFGKAVIADGKTLTVTDKVTAITTLSGELALPNAKSTAAIKTADTAALKLTDTNGSAAKVTIGEVKTKLTVNIVDENGDTIGLVNSRPVLYASGKNLALNKIEIANTSAVFDNALKPFLYGKEIRAENENAIKLDDGTNEKYYPNLELAFNEITDPLKSYAVYLNENIAVSKLTLPKKAESIGFAGPGSLDLNMTALAIPVNTEFSANLNGTNAKPLSITVAAGKTLSISKEAANIGAVKGTKTSSLYINTAVTVGSVSTFGNVAASGSLNNGVLNVTGNVSAVTKLTGTLMLSGIRSTAAITEAATATIKIVDVHGLSAKATVTSVSGEKLKVVFVDENGAEIGIGAGKSVLWIGGRNDIRDDITLVNKAKFNNELELKLYGKEIRADIAQAVEVYDGNESVYYEGLENAFAAISKVKTPKDYTITLNENVSAAKLTIPKTASSIKFKGNGSIDLNMTSLTIPTDVTFLVPVNGTNIKPLAISVAAGKSLTFGEGSDASNIGVVKGARNASFNNSTEMTVGGLASFGYVNAEEVLSVSGKISGISYFSGKLEVTNSKSTVTGIVIEEGAEITLTQTNGVIPKMTVSEFRGNETAKIKIVDEEGEAVKLPSGKTILYSSSKNDFSSKFEIKNPSAAGSGTLKSKLVGKEIKAVNESAVTLMADDVSVGSFATLEEAFAKINALKNSAAHYVITLSDDVYAAKFIMPTKAALLTIDGADFAIWLNNITAITVNTSFILENVTINNTKNYTITAKKSLILYNVVSDCISAIKGTSKFDYREHNSDLYFTGKNGVEQTKVTGFKSIVRR